jgi:Protein of unknown function (DUF2891)
MLEGIAAGLPKGDKRPPMIVAAAEQYKRAGLAAVTGRHYEGGHWLGSFAVYFVTRRGISLKWANLKRGCRFSHYTLFGSTFWDSLSFAACDSCFTIAMVRAV